jgi:hypothetical protein
MSSNSLEEADRRLSEVIKSLDGNVVNVRWWDGYLETFKASEVRFGSDLLWIRLVDGGNRHIPLRNVRWFSLSKESHGV